MVKIYTKKGDDGTTSLWYGGRVPKSHPRTEAYGAIDEAGSALGLARAACGDEHADVAATILRVQDEMFVAGAELATAPEAAGRLEDGVSRITAEMVDELDGEIDRYMERVELPPKFVIPGGTELSARLDFARAVVRRAERRLTELAAAEDLGATEAPRFLNRCSDLIYALARVTDVSEPELFAGRERRR
ncbi:MAG: cob(I)yrinic acid a,c-diamide adenosyltransferase [Solirubrobacteraceae bacterium]